MATNLSAFLKKNKKYKDDVAYKVTASLCDENGTPLDWKIKAVSTEEYERIREKCTTEVQVTGKPGVYRQKFNSSLFIAKLMCASAAEPDLYNKELQDSYGVMNPEDLIKQMIDNPGEYNEFAEFIQKFNGFDETLQDKVNEAKN